MHRFGSSHESTSTNSVRDKLVLIFKHVSCHIPIYTKSIELCTKSIDEQNRLLMHSALCRVAGFGHSNGGYLFGAAINREKQPFSALLLDCG